MVHHGKRNPKFAFVLSFAVNGMLMTHDKLMIKGVA